MAAWFYARGGQQLGPIEFGQLQALAAQRQLAPEDLVWTEGMADWQPAKRIQALSFSPIAQAAQPVSQTSSTPVSYQAINAPSSDQSTLAITGFVLSVLGPFSCGATGLGGVVCGWSALNAMRRTGDYRRRGLALAAVWIGVTDLFIMLVLLILFVIGISIAPN